MFRLRVCGSVLLRGIRFALFVLRSGRFAPSASHFRKLRFSPFGLRRKSSPPLHALRVCLETFSMRENRKRGEKKKCRKTRVFRHNRYRGDSTVYCACGRSNTLTVVFIIAQRKKKSDKFFCRFPFWGGWVIVGFALFFFLTL